ncbi:hypothetical protein NE237_021888 [Protea cynaroides]|uniref:Auxin efflux carrier component n=1 Tax=Protea cynaroides TaxID=273540 RepID=A0A9Q0H9C8_9MAGN|nr:hypothetical protein NE237_021888 [Protea cynaroides]
MRVPKLANDVYRCERRNGIVFYINHLVRKYPPPITIMLITGDEVLIPSVLDWAQNGHNILLVTPRQVCVPSAVLDAIAGFNMRNGNSLGSWCISSKTSDFSKLNGNFKKMLYAAVDLNQYMQTIEDLWSRPAQQLGCWSFGITNTEEGSLKVVLKQNNSQISSCDYIFVIGDMISLADVYHVLEATIPLYVTMILAYMSVKWWKLFTLDQCSGINKFVAKFSIPLLSFTVISKTNPYQMNLKLLLSDSLQKLLAFLLLAISTKISSRGNLDWLITGLSVSTLPNTLILGIPLLKAMYGDEATALLAQIVVLQSLIWYNLLLFLYEFRAAEAVFVTPSLEATGQAVAPQGAQLKEGEETRATTTRKLKIKQILLTVGRKLISNPNTHATLVGLIWAFIHFRWGPNLPVIVDKSISILSDGGLGMAMFSIGLFMASQARIIACGTRMAALAMGTRFLVGPALMAISSLVFGLRSTLFKVVVIQAALPQGIVPFVFAKEYNVHPDILSTGVIFGMLIAIPIAISYYLLLAL